MALKPTVELLNVIKESIPGDYVLPLSFNRAAKIFEIVRDFVLEEAAKACAGVYVGDGDLDQVDAEYAVEECARAIRALKAE